jgi:hypothetical protein
MKIVNRVIHSVLHNLVDYRNKFSKYKDEHAKN